MATFRPMSPLEAGVQMYQSGNMEPFLTVRSDKPRPLSEATEIFDTDFEDEDDSSDFEEESVPKYSFESNDSRKSQTTISTYEEVPTPHSSRRMHFDFQTQERRSIEGPKGPHLFRSSLSSAEFNYEYALQMSPLLPKQPPPRIDTAFRADEVEPMPSALAFEFYAQSEPEPQGRSSDIGSWTAQQVADWMYELGFEDSIIQKFEHHDITGAVLLDMQFEDLKELDIPSFGKRHQLWNHIDELRGTDGRISPQPTPFQDTSRPCTRNTRSNSTRERSRSRPRRRDCEDTEDGSMTPIEPGASRRRRGRRHRNNGDDIITPAESVSIVAIEQLLPKPHHCSKGERCHKWRKQQRQLQRLQEEHGFPISPDKGGHIFIAGDPGNATSATNLVENVYRPTSDALPSVVASSDLLGPGQMPSVALQEDTLRTIESRDPQENVKHFLTLQHMEPPHMQHLPDDRPFTPPLEMFPPLHPPQETQTAHANLRSLPKLNIPRSASANAYGNPRPMQINEYSNTFSPCRTANASPNLYRFGTPASEMDVPLTQVPLGPISRDTSQSVPPGMQYRDPVQRTASSNEWRRPSYVMPSLRENEVYSPSEAHPNSADSATLHDNASTLSQARKKSTDSSSSADMKAHLLNRYEQQHQYTYDGVNHAGWMKKRRTKLLRHEWQDQHFRLAGTRLAMHASDVPESMALDTINVDEYAVACSSLASNKLAAKLKGLKLANGHKKDGSGNTNIDAAAFTFQLVPTGQHGEDKSIVKKTAANGKTHHFAVKTRDERIDWMRELMLAKAMKAKKEGYEVEINGSAV